MATTSPTTGAGPGRRSSPTRARTSAALPAGAVAEAGVAETGMAETGVAETGVAETGVAETGVAEAGVAEAGAQAQAGVVDPRRKPSRAELQAAYGRAVPDLIAPGLKVLICGINPSLAAGATGFHFGGTANRLWATLHQAGFTDRQLHPSETDELLARGIGITNIVNRATARADEISDDEIRAGVNRLTAVVDEYRPGWLAFLGLGAYRIAFGQKKATVGRQPDHLGPVGVWLLPNPSGLNAHYSLPALVEAYRELYDAAYAA